LCGPGNNGGDGYVLARAALEQRLKVRVAALGDPSKLQGDARRACEEFRAAGGETVAWEPQLLDEADVIVDAIFGVGLSRAVEGEIADCIRCVNDSGRHVLAIDIPSGLATDSGHVLGCAVEADRTITFIGLKLGFYLGDGPNCTGIVMCDSLDVPEEAFAAVPASAMRIVDAAFRPTISALPQILHGLARERIRANMTPANRVTLSIDGERVRVVLEAARTTVVSGALGAPARTSGVEAGTRVTPRLSSGWLELLYEGEGSELRQLFSAEPDGSRMHLDYTVSGPQLSRGPVRYRLEYVRR